MDLGGFAPPASRVLAGSPLANVAGGSARGGARGSNVVGRAACCKAGALLLSYKPEKLKNNEPKLLNRGALVPLIFRWYAELLPSLHISGTNTDFEGGEHVLCKCKCVIHFRRLAQVL